MGKTKYKSWKLPLDYPAKKALIIYTRRLLLLTVVATSCLLLGCIALNKKNLLPICVILLAVLLFVYMVVSFRRITPLMPEEEIQTTVCIGNYNGEVSYSNQARVAKIFATLLASMTIGAIILMSLGHNPPSAGPFSMWTYYRLNPVKKAISSRVAQSPERWNRIEIYYSGTKSGNIEQLARSNGLKSSVDLNCHFVICNGFGGYDGQIQPTEKWQRQWSSIPDNTWNGSDKTIRICIIADGKSTHPTDCQLKRIQVLVEALCKKFYIPFTSIDYPSEWR
jgi:hypothetical protein